MSDTLTDDHVTWAQTFTGVGISTPGQTTDPNADAQSVDPNAGAQSTDPNAGTQSVDPNAGAQSTDPNAGAQSADPNAGAQSVDPNAGAQSTDPNAGAQSADPNAGTQSVDPNAGAQNADPNAGVQSTDPNAGTQSVDPNAGAQSTDPNAGTQSVDPNAGAQSTDPNDGAQNADPNAGSQGVDVNAAAPGGGTPSNLPAVSIGVEVPVGELEWEYVTAEGAIKYEATYKLAGSTSETEIKFDGLKPQIETKLKEKLTSSTSVKGGTTVSDRKGTIDVAVETELGDGLKTSVAFEFIEADNKKGKVNFATLKWETESQLAKGEIEVADLKIEYERKYAVSIRFKPNWAKIGAYAAEKLGIQVGEDAALGAAAGGTGALGAAAVAAAPVAGILGGLVGGVALAVGVCAGIGKLEDLGADATAVCQDGARQLQSYADSYGSTMRGKPGSDAKGNQDAEAALQEIMSKTPGLMHDQAVQAAMNSKQNYEQMVYQRLLPDMRDKVRAAYKQKEGTLGYLFAGNTLEIVIKEFLGG